MAKFNKEELQKIAQLSALKLNAQELEVFAEQIEKTLQYIDELEQFSATTEQEAVHNINVFREDKAIEKDSAPLLAQAPETKETYYSVPKILE